MSKKRRTFNEKERKPFVAQYLKENSFCERCQDAPSTEVHEKLSRGRSGSNESSLVDPENCMALCHDCHHYITFIATEEECLENDWLRQSSY